uniref:Uncharacterized protein n=1 Tax=Setaria italica TaxID=4555 RepID=K4ANI6_SETIT
MGALLMLGSHIPILWEKKICNTPLAEKCFPTSFHNKQSWALLPTRMPSPLLMREKETYSFC